MVLRSPGCPKAGETPPSPSAGSEVGLVVWPISNKNASTECRTMHVRTKWTIPTAWFLTSLVARNLEQLAARVAKVAIVVLGKIRIGIVGDLIVGVPGETHDGIVIAAMTDDLIDMTDDDFLEHPVYFSDISKKKFRDSTKESRVQRRVYSRTYTAPPRCGATSGQVSVVVQDWHWIRPSCPLKIHNSRQLRCRV